MIGRRLSSPKPTKATRDSMPTTACAYCGTRRSYLHKTAVGLAALHRTDIDAGPAYGWEDELAEVRAFVDHLAAAVPELTGAATSLLAMLDVDARATPPDPPV